MPRVQAIVVKGDAVLLVKHRSDGREWWCLPGGALEQGETPEDGALRELREECGVAGVVVRQTSYVCLGPGDETYSFLVDIGDQSPTLGAAPEVPPGREVLCDVRWLRLREVPERDRVFLWAAGLLGTGRFRDDVESWSDEVSCPGEECSSEFVGGVPPLE